MSKIKKLSVMITYEVDLKDIEIPKKVLKELTKANKECHPAFRNDGPSKGNYGIAAEWLYSNIQEVKDKDVIFGITWLEPYKH